MNWFKNLNATPRLMISFGLLLALTLGISYLSISNLNSANDRLQSLYQNDMKGVIAVAHIDSSRKDLAQKDRDALIKIDDAASVATDLTAVRADFASMKTNLPAAEQCFYTKRGKEIIGDIQANMPDYEKSVEVVLDAIQAKDISRAKEALYALAPLAAHVGLDIDQAIALKEANGEEKFQANLDAYHAARNLVVGAAILSLAFGVILTFVIARSFSIPLGQAVATLEQVAAGDLTASLDVHTADEVGRMARALNAAVESMNRTMQEVAETATSASSSSQQLAAASEAIASGAQEQAASLEETSASLEEITASVRQSADNAQQASQLAISSKDSALQGQEVVSKAITAMEEINAASAKISDIISTIDEIAFQTNLLAVNAAVEAARAGDEGRGFAVVASEVRSLAQRSAVAAKEIKVLIQDSLRKVDAGSVLVNRSGETLQGIVGSVKRVTDIVGEIAASSAEQSSGVEQVNTAMTQMDQVTQSNSAQTEELSATAHSLSDQSAHLLELVSAFTLSRDTRVSRDRKSFQLREADAGHFVGASLVQAAKPGLVKSTTHLSSTTKSGQRLAGSARNAASSKPELHPRGKSTNNSQPAVETLTLNGAGGDDSSFEEY